MNGVRQTNEVNITLFYTAYSFSFNKYHNQRVHKMYQNILGSSKIRFALFFYVSNLYKNCRYIYISLCVQCKRYNLRTINTTDTNMKYRRSKNFTRSYGRNIFMGHARKKEHLTPISKIYYSTISLCIIILYTNMEHVYVFHICI